MSKNRVVHFEIVAIDPERAAKFYREVFDWEIKKWEDSGEMDYWLVTTASIGTPNAINGGIRKEMGTDVKEKTKSVNAFINFVAVNSVDNILKKVESSGGEIMQPKMVVPKVGDLAYCMDTEGNMFGVIRPDMENM